jgi:hypothetical protein
MTFRIVVEMMKKKRVKDEITFCRFMLPVFLLKWMDMITKDVLESCL